VLTGTSIEKAGRERPELVALLRDYRAQLPGGESYESFRERVVRAFWEVARSGERAVAIVTHGGPIRCLAREVLKRGELKSLGDLAVLEVVVEGSSATLKTLRRAELEG
jgi:broad specificity phosphatase PhoE